MRRVRVIAFVYSVANSPLAGVIVVLSLVFVSGMIVSLDHVITNTLAYTDWGTRFSYTVSSFEHTRTVVQILVACIAALGLFIFYNSIRTIRRSGFFALFTMRRAG